MKPLQKLISTLFGVLFFTVPLILWPYTSELFEFNKMVVVYLLTVPIISLWIIRMISEKKFIFRRTILDIPLLCFLGSQLISALLSIDPLSSWLGYYSRFNGGLASIISYTLLYWAMVSNIDRKNALKLINITFVSAFIVSIYGVLERLGIDKNIWQQDVQSRVFSTLGQPNWLAAWLVALTPVTWLPAIKEKGHKFSLKTAVPYILSSLFFMVLLFTGSRSGLVGFAAVEIIFWGFVFFKHRLKYFKQFLILNALLLLIALIFGTQFTPGIDDLVKKSVNNKVETVEVTGSTSLETGGTESGAIRKIVWEGAIEIWKHYPVFGTGVETFAYSYYLYRPASHNLTSEWDYIYNKAHNEYLNFMANSGTIGIISYLVMVGFVVYLMSKNSLSENEDDEFSPLMSVAFISGYISILITNFFGFSVVPVQLIFYTYPAFSVIFTETYLTEKENKKYLSSNQKTLNWIVVFIAIILTYIICRYWYADYLYAKGSSFNKINKQDQAVSYLNRAIKLEPNQSIYYGEISKSYSTLALAYNEAKLATTASQLTEAAIDTSIKSVELSPANVNLKRIEFGVFVMLSSLDPNYFLNARDVLEVAVKQAPTDSKLYYNLGLIYSRTGQTDLAIEALKKTVDLKPNYKDARLAYAILLINAKRNDEARIQLQYVLANIDPTDSIAKQYLESIK